MLNVTQNGNNLHSRSENLGKLNLQCYKRTRIFKAIYSFRCNRPRKQENNTLGLEMYKKGKMK